MSISGYLAVVNCLCIEILFHLFICYCLHCIYERRRMNMCMDCVRDYNFFCFIL
uniref:Uncharacterized protein n=1 Tax=Arundo donax TaxID=35708 RepID=A0A0A8Y038_ARUDO